MIPSGYTPPGGPSWIPAARVGEIIRDARGVRWEVSSVTDGGRVLHWLSCEVNPRVATTTATPATKGYPSDADVIAWEREQKKAAARAARSPWGFYP